MDKKLAGIYLIMKELGGFRIAEFDERLFLQKAIYLVQVLGTDLRFRFSWYLRGPYSKDLTYCAFEIEGNNDLKASAEKLRLNDSALGHAKQLKTLLDNAPTGLGKPEWFELLSSIHYLKYISLPTSDVSVDNIKSLLEDAGKSAFTGDQVNAAWKALESVRLIQ